MAKKKGGLGKGLDAIFAENESEGEHTAVMLKLSELEPNRSQPRHQFNEQALSELADSISRYGVLQPLLVRPLLSGGYQIVAGERRWRAARMAGVDEGPAVVTDLTDEQVMELALIENLQREDLNPLEEAQGFQSLMDTYGMTQDEVAKTVGKSRPAVANALRLMNLPESIQKLVSAGTISAGHARALLSFPDKKSMAEAAKVAADGASVREIEKMAQKVNTEPKEQPQKRKNKYYAETELALREHLGRKVSVSGTKKRGILQIEFYGEDDLVDLMKNFKNT